VREVFGKDNNYGVLVELRSTKNIQTYQEIIKRISNATFFIRLTDRKLSGYLIANKPLDHLFPVNLTLAGTEFMGRTCPPKLFDRAGHNIFCTAQHFVI